MYTFLYIAGLIRKNFVCVLKAKKVHIIIYVCL